MDVSIFARRLVDLRQKKGWTQRQLANELSERFGPTDAKAEALSYITISAYERASRMPPINTLIAICQLFDVSLDYMCGLDSSPKIKKSKKKSNRYPFEEPDILIDHKELKKYDGNPVFIVSPQKGIAPSWGILDMAHRVILTRGTIIPLSSDLQLYMYPPIEALFTDVSSIQPLTYTQLIDEYKPVYVRMLNAEGYVHGLYDGWYRKNETDSALINASNGLVLPYSGCGLSYNAYNL